MHTLLQIETRVHKYVDAARKVGLPVSKDGIRSFDFQAKTDMRSSSALLADVRELVEWFLAGDHWVRNHIERRCLTSATLHGEAGRVDKAAIEEKMMEI